jgi:hypothetical protein
LTGNAILLNGVFPTANREIDVPGACHCNRLEPSGGFNIDAFVARLPGGGKHPAILAIHDSLGLEDSNRDITKQPAAAEFFVGREEIHFLRLPAGQPRLLRAGGSLQCGRGEARLDENAGVSEEVG